MCLPNILFPVFMFPFIFHCRSFSPCWPLAFLIFSPPLWISMFFFLRNSSPLFSVSLSSSFSLIHVSVKIKNNAEKETKTMHLIKRIRRLFEATRMQQYPGYQRFFLACDGELRFVGRRPSRVRPKAEDTSGVWPKTGNRASGTQGTATGTSLKSEFVFFQSLWRLFLPTYFVNCRRTVLKLNFKGPYLILEREMKFRRCLFTLSKTRN